jgi:DNA-directed RNA polymerase alpha subunit
MTQAWDFVDADVLWQKHCTILDRDIRMCELSVRTTNTLLRFRYVTDTGCVSEPVDTVRKLIECTDYELMRQPNFGRKSLREVVGFLDAYGLHLKTGV